MKICCQNLKIWSWNLEIWGRNLENLTGFWKFFRILEIFCWKFLVHRLDRVFSGFGEENQDQPAGVGFWNKWLAADRWLDRVGQFLGQIRLEPSSGSGLRIGWTALVLKMNKFPIKDLWVSFFFGFLAWSKPKWLLVLYLSG